jgi:DNA-binding CsgD family transcriptional regulator
MGRERQTTTGLTPRQREVLRLVARGHTNGEIGEILGISLAGAKWHVAELMGKLNVNSREDLAESYLEEQRAGARLARWWSGALGVVSLKPWVTATAAVLAVAAAGVGTTFGLALMNGGAAEPSQTESEQAATATPSPTPTPVPLPSAPGAIWTADEALRKAEALASEVATEFDGILGYTPDIASMRLASATWNPGISHYDSPDGDHFWERTDGARNAWGFMWTETRLAGPAGGTPREVVVTAEILIEDGKDALALRLNTVEVATGYSPRWGGDGFFSRAELAELRARLPAGPAVTFGWYNDFVDGGAWIEAYPAGGGYWCVWGRDSVGGGNGQWCQPDHDSRDAALKASLSTTFTVSGEMGEATLFVDAVPSITSLKALPGDGRELTFATYAPPTQSGITRRFAWITIGKIGSSYTLIGYDVAGNEVARFGNEAPGPPPPPPPSPTPSP